LLVERAKMGMEGVRGARRRAFHQSTVAEDRARVRHATDQNFALSSLALGRHADHATAVRLLSRLSVVTSTTA
jgi:hypothetical protein